MWSNLLPAGEGSNGPVAPRCGLTAPLARGVEVCLLSGAEGAYKGTMAREVHLGVDSGDATVDIESGGATRWGERGRRAGVEGGFTMIEVLLVVGMVAILAMLATYGVRRHLAHAKSA